MTNKTNTNTPNTNLSVDDISLSIDWEKTNRRIRRHASGKTGRPLTGYETRGNLFLG